MPAAVPLAPARPPRRARYLVPLGAPRRRETLAAAAVAAVVASALFAPLTLILTAAFHAVSKLSRWRPLWLSAPAAGGIVWTLAIGPRAAGAAFGRGPAAAAAAVSRALASPAAAARLPGVVARGLPGQLPLALVLAAGAAAGAWWVRWMHTDEWDLPAPRLGLLGVYRRERAAASLRAGRVVTRDGACLGFDEATGRAAVLSWRDAGGGVLVTGAAPPAVLGSGLQLAHAAIRRRKPVIVVDPAGHPGLAGALAAICAAARAPLHSFEAAPAGLAEAVRQRSVVLCTLDPARSGRTAGAVAGQVAAELAALFAGLNRSGIAPDGLCWLTECEGADPAALAALVAAGSPAGLAPVLATTVPSAASALAGQVNAAVIHRLADRGLAAELASLTGTTVRPISRALAGEAGPEAAGMPLRAEASPAVPFGTVTVPVVPAGQLCALGQREFVLVTRLAAARAGGGRGGGPLTVPRCRAVPARIPRRPGAAGPGASGHRRRA